MSNEQTGAWAVISPDGELTWYPLSKEREVRALVGGDRAPGALDTATVTRSLFGRGPLRVLASDVALLFPEDYPPNPLAQRVLTALSGDRISQPWRGHVALVEYEADPASGEVLWPGEMCPHWTQAISTAVRRGQDNR
jgi:hypothetical protein